MSELGSRYTAIVERVRAAASGRAVTLIAVSKSVEASRIEELHRLGHRDFGENYAQELVAKAAELAARGIRDIRWHFIGHLQSNKARQVVPLAHAVHSVDSAKLARELAKRWREAGRAGRLSFFIEVNIDEEEGKSGVAPAEAKTLATESSGLAELELRGLMCVPKAREPGRAGAELRASFARLRELGRDCGCPELSMGMSGDFELALAEGATAVRVGTAIFGPRAP